MKFGLRIPSINKKISSRTSINRIVKNSLGLKMPKGYGWINNPEKALYNKVYNRTTSGCMLSLMFFGFLFIILIAFVEIFQF